MAIAIVLLHTSSHWKFPRGHAADEKMAQYKLAVPGSTRTVVVLMATYLTESPCTFASKDLLQAEVSGTGVSHWFQYCNCHTCATNNNVFPTYRRHRMCSAGL